MLLGLCVASEEQSLERNVIFVGAFFCFISLVVWSVIEWSIKTWADETNKAAWRFILDESIMFEEKNNSEKWDYDVLARKCSLCFSFSQFDKRQRMSQKVSYILQNERSGLALCVVINWSCTSKVVSIH